ncbi:hypothetical protein HK099_004408 [Clydaea vesicula]|uniref:Mitogen-activated protein kinase kinase kinase n=1 Tax=Clydaea vesicula TaxID=447962 RepID=A0AAD5U6V5_9FUNG|nr:hypothetical protein HK099_004408 [Clydaea vesicula]
MEIMERWNEDKVGEFLEENGFTQFKKSFRQNNINGEILLELTYETLKDLGILSVGERAKVLRAIKVVKNNMNLQLHNQNNQRPIVKTKSSNDINTVTNPLSITIPITSPNRARSDTSPSSAVLVRTFIAPPRQMNNQTPPPPLATSTQSSVLKKKGSVKSNIPFDMSPLIITPRSSSMSKNQNQQLSSAALNSASINPHIGNLFPVNNSHEPSLKSPRSSSPVSPITQLINLGFYPDDKKRDDLSSKASKNPDKDLMEIESVKNRCIRVKGINNQHHIIDIFELNDAKLIREKIFHKFNIPDNERHLHAIFAIDHSSIKENNMINLDDTELLSICKSQNNPLKANLTIRKQYFFNSTEQQQQRKKELEKLNQSPSSSEVKKEVKRSNKLAKFFGASPPKSNSSNSLEDIVSPPSFNPSQISQIQFFQNSASSVNKQQLIHNQVTSDDFEQPVIKSKKLLDFFGERPPDELIADQLEQFFPGITQRQSQMYNEQNLNQIPSDAYKENSSFVRQSTISINSSALNNIPFKPSPQAVEAVNIPIVSSSSFTGESVNLENLPTSDIKNIVQAAMINKRLSKVAHRTSVLQKRATNIPPGRTFAFQRNTRQRISSESNKIEEENDSSRRNTISNVLAEYGFSQTNLNNSSPTTPSTLTGSTSAINSYVSEASLPLPGQFSRSSVNDQNSPQLQEDRNPTLESTPEPTPQGNKRISMINKQLSPTKLNFIVNETLQEEEVLMEDDVIIEKTEEKNIQNMERQSHPGGEQSLLHSEQKIVVEKQRKSLPAIKRWEQGKMIGQGAFGKVFLGINLDTGELLAVKQVIIGDENDSQKKKREDALRGELELLKELEHEYIVRYMGFEIKDLNFNVFLEYVSGGSVSSLLGKVIKFDDSLTRSISYQILVGLEYLHDRRIIHRDIKGANRLFCIVLIDADGVAKISDFGISKKNEYVAYQRMTRMSTQGTVNWMAPEVVKGKGYSAKCDIWSVGCLVMEMLTGYPPWKGVMGNIILLLGRGNSPPIPEELTLIAKDFIKLCFTNDPEKRPTATELLLHPYVQIDPTQLDFKQWYEEALEVAMAQKQALKDLEPSSDESSSDEDSYDSESEEGSQISMEDLKENNEEISEENNEAGVNENNAIPNFEEQLDEDGKDLSITLTAAYGLDSVEDENYF